MPEAAPASPPQIVTTFDSGIRIKRRSNRVKETAEVVDKPVELVLGVIAASYGEMTESNVFSLSTILGHHATLEASIQRHGTKYGVPWLC